MSDIIDRTLAFLLWRKREYQITFPKGAVAPETVLADLAVFCRVNEDDLPGDSATKIAYMAGRRSVFLRIQRHLNLSQNELFDLYSGVRTPSPREQQ